MKPKFHYVRIATPDECRRLPETVREKYKFPPILVRSDGVYMLVDEGQYNKAVCELTNCGMCLEAVDIVDDGATILAVVRPIEPSPRQA